MSTADREIKVLPDDVINKIAAGEVVERPASIVKELVENAIDAGASRIEVDLTNGGQQGILVTDNGCGIRADLLELAVKRHATSKIHSAGELFDIHSLGFRGEALASISEVSRFTLQSRRSADHQGMRLTKCDEKGVQMRPVSCPIGTVVGVDDLFYNVPARRKFLRTGSTEFAHSLELVHAFCLSNPHVALQLSHNGKIQFLCDAVAKSATDRAGGQSTIIGEALLRLRCKDVLGEDTAKALIYEHRRNDYGEVEVLFSPPGLDRPTSRSMYSFVNCRWVKDKAVRLGIQRGYHSHQLKNRYPIVLLYLQVDPGLVDVNVHPAKTELRFQYPGEVQALIALAIRDGLRKGTWAMSSFDQASTAVQHGSVVGVLGRQEGADGSRAKDHGGSWGGARRDESESAVTGIKIRVKEYGAESPAQQAARNIDRPLAEYLRPSTSSTMAGISRHDSAIQAESSRTFPLAGELERDARGMDWQRFEYLGGFASCYLLFAALDEKLVVVDQHAFHERILYERLVAMDAMLLTSQRLLVPECIELGSVAVARLREYRDRIEELGFVLFFPEEHVSVEVRAVPNILVGKDISSVLRKLAEQPPVENQAAELGRIHGPFLESVACHAAVRAGEALTAEQVGELVCQASEVDFFHNCPHGRRVIRVFSRAEVGRWFDRPF